jgi:CRISPR/Cas system CMR subunit Cmr6 (Cas7 group RAMP superfamily)
MKAAHVSSLQNLEWGHPKPVSFLNVNNLVFVLALASLLIMLNAISLVHQVHL